MRAWLWLLLVARSADASPLIGAVAATGVGVAAGDSGYEGPDAKFRVVNAFELDVGVRVVPKLMLGAHVGFASGLRQYVGTDDHLIQTITQYTYRPLQLGITAHVSLHDRVWAGPWIGMQGGWRREDCTSIIEEPGSNRPPANMCVASSFALVNAYHLAYGVSIGADVYVRAGHRATIIAATTHSDGDVEANFRYTSFWLGVGYRFWSD